MSDNDNDKVKGWNSEHDWMCNKKLREAGHSLSQEMWTCKCGHDAFYVMDTCYQCQQCGEVHDPNEVHGGI